MLLYLQIFWLRALLIHSEFSPSMNACLALWRKCKFSSRILMVGVSVRAGDLLVAAQGKIGFWAIAIWSITMNNVREFLALIAHHSVLQGISPTLKYLPHPFLPSPRQKILNLSDPPLWATPLKALENLTTLQYIKNFPKILTAVFI